MKLNEPNIVGVIGHPIKHSLSPFMHNTAFELAGLNYIYLSFDVVQAQLANALKGIVALDIKGFNVTLPFKETIIELLDEISEEASVVGAVNTIVNDTGRLFGYNTDTNGVWETLMPYKEKINDNVVSILGSGGAARSVIYILIRKFNPKKIVIINRTLQRAESLADYFTSKMNFSEFETLELVPPDISGTLAESSLIINTTSLGLFPKIDDTPFELGEAFHQDQIVFDVIYNPLKTKFLTLAEEKGAKVLNGLKMFVEQGARAYELWTGEKMPKAKVYLELEKELSSNENTPEKES